MQYRVAVIGMGGASNVEFIALVRIEAYDRDGVPLGDIGVPFVSSELLLVSSKTSAS